VRRIVAPLLEDRSLGDDVERLVAALEEIVPPDDAVTAPRSAPRARHGRG
jgi:hypothetical protein